jgi:hypothetical protein
MGEGLSGLRVQSDADGLERWTDADGLRNSGESGMQETRNAGDEERRREGDEDPQFLAPFLPSSIPAFLIVRAPESRRVRYAGDKDVRKGEKKMRTRRSLLRSCLPLFLPS